MKASLLLTQHVYNLGDLGTTASEVETALERNFSLANRWGSILLLDEADVFLAQRSPKNFIRNGLVAGTSHSLLLQYSNPHITDFLRLNSLPPRPRILRRHPLPHNQPHRRLRRSLCLPHPRQPLLPAPRPQIHPQNLQAQPTPHQGALPGEEPLHHHQQEGNPKLRKRLLGEE